MNGQLGVLHLVRKANGPEPLNRFLESYRACPAGCRHELVLVLKGFESQAEVEPYVALAADLDYRSISVADDGYDIGAYLAAVERLQFEAYCFLNSFSRVLVPGWLQHLTEPLTSAGVGIVGSSSSWGSIGSYARFMVGLGGPYGSVFSDRQDTNRAMARQEAARDPFAVKVSRLKRYSRSARALADQSHGFPRFPNPHIRTTGFMIRHDVLKTIRVASPKRKVDTYRLESGRAGITAQVRRLDLRTVVVGRDGAAHEPASWPESFTFWAGGQQNLLIADKQTDAYEYADRALRVILAGYAWGHGAPPSE
jgi:hypothetical protein